MGLSRLVGPAVRLRHQRSGFITGGPETVRKSIDNCSHTGITSACRSAPISGGPHYQLRILPSSSRFLALRLSWSLTPSNNCALIFHSPHDPLSTASSRALPILASHAQTRSHVGHSHSAHRHHDHNTYLTSKNKRDPGVRITRIGLFVNLGMAAAKGAGGYFFNSQALMADAFHALTDLVSDVMTLATISWSWKPPTARFPTGYGKVESLGSLGVSGLLLSGGIFMALNACNSLYAQFFLDVAAAAQHTLHSHGHSHDAASLIPDIKAAWLAAGTIVVKEWLYRATMKVARERKSSVLASNAVHHRVDSLTGLVAFIAVGGAHLLNGATWLDPVGSLIVSMMVIRAGWSNTTAALLELADVAVDEETIDSVRQAAKKSVAPLIAAGTLGEEVIVRDVQGLKSGQNYLIDILLAVPNDWSVEKTQAVETLVREGVGATVRGVRRVKVRFVPHDHARSRFTDEFLDPNISQRNSPEPEGGRGDSGHQHKA